MSMRDEGLSCIRRNYACRLQDPRYRRLWYVANPQALFHWQTRERALARALGRNGFTDKARLAKARLLDVGCGDGQELGRMVVYGAHPSHCFGVDLMPQHVLVARRTYGGSRFAVANAGELPFENAQFDLGMCHVVFSSIPADRLRRAAGAEIMRVLRPGAPLL